MRNLFEKLFPSRSLTLSLLIRIEIITTLTMLLVGMVFFVFSSVQMRKNLIKNSVKKADEIVTVIKIPLYNLDNDAVRDSAKIFLSSDTICGIKIVSDIDGVLVDSPSKKKSRIPSIERKIYHKKIFLGSVRIDFSDEKIQDFFRTTIAIIFISILSLVLINAFLIILTLRQLIQEPFEAILKKVKKVAHNDFGGNIKTFPQEDLNTIASSINQMSLNLKKYTDFLRESESRYRQLFNNSFVAFFIHNSDGKILDVNQRTLDLFEFSSKEEIFKYSIQDLSAKNNDFHLLPHCFQAALSGQPQTFSWISYSPVTKKTFDTFVSLNKIEAKNQSWILASVLDISEQKKIEQKLIQAQKMEAVGILAGGLAHDFNNVLMGISGSVSLLRFQFKDQNSISFEELREHIDIIEHATLRASGMVQQLLSISKKQDLSMKIIDLNQSIENVLKIAKSSFDKSIRFEVHLYPSPAMVWGDPTQLEQIILNLCVNSAHAMTLMRPPNEPWGGTLEIQLKQIQNDEFFRKRHTDASQSIYWDLSIKDNGVGIPKDQIQKIFTPFFTTKGKGMGTGLGLSMVYTLITEHKGLVDVYSEPGQGTVFHLYFPLYTQKGKTPIEENKTIDFYSEGKVLIIDDEKMVRQLVKKMLQKIGFIVFEAKDGKEGIEIFKKHTEISLVILDLVMPKLSAKKTFSEIRKINPKIKVLLHSGFQKDPRIQEILNLGANEFIVKPYTLDKLIETLQKFL